MARDRILILAKTYPNPSAKYVETTCIAGINQAGQMRRLYPVPFRFLSVDSQFKKWQWIEADTQKARADHRSESYNVIDRDNILLLNVIGTQKKWKDRSIWWEKIPHGCYPKENQKEINEKRFPNEIITCLAGEKSLILLDNIEIIDLEIKERREKNWTEDELRKIKSSIDQEDMFFDKLTLYNDKSPLKKLPCDFYYTYNLFVNGEKKVLKTMITDWEIGAAFWKFRRDYGDNWEMKFRQKFLSDMQTKDIKFLLGNMHTHRNQWLIISLIYPPIIPEKLTEKQADLFGF